MLKSMTLVRRRARLAAVSIAAVGMVVGNLASVSAALLTNASAELSDPRPDETSVTYTIDASGFTASTANCVQVVFNDQADGAGSVPSSMVTTGASLSSSTAIPTPGSWTADYTVNGTLELSFVAGETLVSGDLVFGGITNGDTEGTTYFALVDTYSDAGCVTGGLDSQVLAFVYKDGEPVSLEIEPTLTFTCVGVASGLDVFPAGGPAIVDTTVLSDAAGINHGTTVTSSTNGISAHDLNISTNASNGYNVYIRHTGQLTNENSDVIADHGGTNAVPTAFAAPGTEGWGYTTDDADLTQFYGLNLWSGFPTAGGSGGDQVVTNADATNGTQTVRVGHQVGVAVDTPAGTYTTTIVYTIVATF